MKRPSDFSTLKKRDSCISESEQDIVEKPSNYSTLDVQDRTSIRSSLKCNEFYRNRCFTKALSLEELDIQNKIWIGNYLDICLKKRKKYVKF